MSSVKQVPDFLHIRKHETSNKIYKLDDLFFKDSLDIWIEYNKCYILSNKENIIKTDLDEKILNWYNIHKKDTGVDLIINIINIYNKFIFCNISFDFINKVIKLISSEKISKIVNSLSNKENIKKMKDINVNSNIRNIIFEPIQKQLINNMINEFKKTNDINQLYNILSDYIVLENDIAGDKKLNNELYIQGHGYVIDIIFNQMSEDFNISPLIEKIFKDYVKFESLNEKFDTLLFNYINNLNITDEDMLNSKLLKKLMILFNNINIISKISTFTISKYYTLIWDKNIKLSYYLNTSINQLIESVNISNIMELSIYNILESFYANKNIDLCLTEYKNFLLNRKNINYEFNMLNILKKNIVNNNTLTNIELLVADIINNSNNNKELQKLNLIFCDKNNKINIDFDKSNLTFNIKNGSIWDLEGDDIIIPSELYLYQQIFESFVKEKYINKKFHYSKKLSIVDITCNGYQIIGSLELISLIFELINNPSIDEKYEQLIKYNLAKKINNIYEFNCPTSNISL
jgi:hypothetical protein